MNYTTDVPGAAAIQVVFMSSSFRTIRDGLMTFFCSLCDRKPKESRKSGLEAQAA
jgi:hypothetical protein